MPDEIIIIDDWVDALSEETHMRIFVRALRNLGVPHTLKNDGSYEPEFDHDDLPDHDLIEAAMDEQYKKMHAAELLHSLAANGDIRPGHVDPESGEVIYVKG